MKNVKFHPQHAESAYCDACIPAPTEHDRAELMLFEDSFRRLLRPGCDCAPEDFDRCRQVRVHRDCMEQTVSEAHEMRITWESSQAFGVSLKMGFDLQANLSADFAPDSPGYRVLCQL